MGLDAQVRALRQPIRLPVVGKYLARLCLIAALLDLAPLGFSLASTDWPLAIRWAVTVLALGLPELLMRPLPLHPHLGHNEALAVLALAYLLIGVIQAYPLLAPDLSFADALFESISALTTTGLSTLPGVEQRTPAYLFSRAWIQWYGGVGIAIISLAVLIRRSAAARHLIDNSLEQEDLVGSTRAHTRHAVAVYLLLSVLGFLLLWPLLGAWHALLYTLTGISTGGFSPHDASLGALPPVAQPVVLMVACSGAVPLVLYFRSYRLGWRNLLRDPEARGLVTLILALTLLMAPALALQGLPWEDAWRHAPLLVASAQSGTGFSSMGLSDLAPAAALVLIAAMFIGGGLASTSGGIHVFRFLLTLRLIRVMILRACLPPHAVVETTLGQRRIQPEDALPAVLTVLLFLLVILLSWAAFLSCGYQPLASLFEITSATATVGLSSGITSQGLPWGLKLLLCADMLLGRLEILAFLVLLCPSNWKGKRDAGP